MSDTLTLPYHLRFSRCLSVNSCLEAEVTTRRQSRAASSSWAIVFRVAAVSLAS